MAEAETEGLNGETSRRPNASERLVLFTAGYVMMNRSEAVFFQFLKELYPLGNAFLMLAICGGAARKTNELRAGCASLFPTQIRFAMVSVEFFVSYNLRPRRVGDTVQFQRDEHSKEPPKDAKAKRAARERRTNAARN